MTSMGPPPRLMTKKKKPEELRYEQDLMTALTKLSELEKRHRILVDDYQILGEKYIYTKRCCMEAAWSYIPRNSKQFAHMPKEARFKESDEAVESYVLGPLIGSGQHSLVNSCTDVHGREYAIKRIRKDQIRSAEGVLRVEREIGSLLKLQDHPNILPLHNVLHGTNRVHLVTQRCTMDLFDFIDKVLVGILPRLAFVSTPCNIHLH